MVSKITIDYSIIGDGLIRQLDIWISGPFHLRSPGGVSTTSPTTLRDVYQDMNWKSRPIPRGALPLGGAHTSSRKSSLPMPFLDFGVTRSIFRVNRAILKMRNSRMPIGRLSMVLGPNRLLLGRLSPWEGVHFGPANSPKMIPTT